MESGLTGDGDDCCVDGEMTVDPVKSRVFIVLL